MQPQTPQVPQQGNVQGQVPTGQTPVGAPINQPFQSTIPPQGQGMPMSYAPMRPKKSFAGLMITVVLILSLIGSLGFGIWAFSSREDYKNNSDQKSAAAVEVALAKQQEELKVQFDEAAKSPFETYSGPSTAGSVKVVYPRTWSAYVTEEVQSQSPVNGYFHPGFVPKTIGGADVVAFALRLEVSNQSYSQVMQQYESYVKQGSINAQPVTLANVPGSVGTLFKGAIVPGVTKIDGTMLIMPIRDKTLRIWTESNSAYGSDFENTILPNLDFED